MKKKNAAALMAAAMAASLLVGLRRRCRFQQRSHLYR